MARLCIKIIIFYQKYISLFLPRRCRFYPTCSQYAYEAITKYGLLRGLLKSMWRIVRCNPFNPGGYDPV